MGAVLEQTILDVKIISGHLREDIIIPLLNNSAKGKNWTSLDDTFTVVSMDFQTHATQMTNPTLGISPRYATQLSFLDTVTEVYVTEMGSKAQ